MSLSHFCFHLTLFVWLHMLHAITGEEQKLFISVFKNQEERSHTGLLLLSLGEYYNHTQDGPLCGQKTEEISGSVELIPTQASADVLCKFANLNGLNAIDRTNKYHRAEWVRVAGGGYYVDYKYFTSDWSQDLKPALQDVTCIKDTSTSPHKYSCSHSKYDFTADNCEGEYTKMAAISCGCDPNFYRTDEGCFKCPCNSQSDGFQSRCECNAGYYYNTTFVLVGETNKTADTTFSSCIRCEEGTYSLQNSTSCTLSTNGTFGGVDGEEALDWCRFTCNLGEVEVGGKCMSNSTLGVIVLAVAVVFLGAVSAWRFRRYQRTVLRRRSTSRGSAKPRVVANRVTEDSDQPEPSDQQV